MGAASLGAAPARKFVNRNPDRLPARPSPDRYCFISTAVCII